MDKYSLLCIAATGEYSFSSIRFVPDLLSPNDVPFFSIIAADKLHGNRIFYHYNTRTEVQACRYSFRDILFNSQIADVR